MDSPKTAGNIDRITTSAVQSDSKTPKAENQADKTTETTSGSSSNPTADLSAKLWADQAQQYLNGAEYKSSVAPPQDTRDLKMRVEAFGLNNFKTFDHDKDGKIEADDVRWAYEKPDKLAEQLLVANFKQIDSSDDGKVTSEELVAISQDKFKLATLPDTRIVDHSAPDVEAQKKALGLINQQLDQHPHKSPNDFFDQSVKAMAQAVVKGDTQAFDAMVKNFSSTQNLGGITEAVDNLLKGSGVHVRNEYGHIEVGREFGERVDFSPNDKPHSNSLTLSAEDAMKSLSKNIGENSGSLKSQYDYEDRVEQRHERARELIKDFSTKLTEDDGLILLQLLDSAKHGDNRQFDVTMRGMVDLRPKSIDRVSRALNELTGDKGVSFNVFTWNRQTVIQARNSDGSKTATFSPNIKTQSNHSWVLKAIKEGPE